MGVQHTYGTAGATGGGWSSQPGTLQPAYAEQCHEPRWQWQARAPKTWRDRNQFTSLWSFGCRTESGNGSGQDGSTPVRRDIMAPDIFEPYSCDGEGTQTLKFIKGQCVDASGNVAAGAIVQAFRTSDDAFAGLVDANSTDGQFSVPSPYPGVAHYLVAYKPGSPDIGGTTVNTLIPTGIDGV
jgi:hypothetical protein